MESVEGEPLLKLDKLLRSPFFARALDDSNAGRFQPLKVNIVHFLRLFYHNLSLFGLPAHTVRLQGSAATACVTSGVQHNNHASF